MKKLVYLIPLLLCILSLNLKAQADKSAINVSVGMPILTSPLNIGKLSSNIIYYRNLTKKVNFCIGINYDNIDLPPSDNLFTFDKEYIGIFLGTNYQIKIAQELHIYPEINIGYSIVNYSVNEFEFKIQKTSGFLLSESLILNYQLTNKFGINLKCYNTTLLKKLVANVPSPINANYTGASQKSNSISIKLGLTIEL